MHPLVRGAAAVAVISALGNLAPEPPPPAPSIAPPATSGGLASMPSPCGPGTIPEGRACVRMPGAVALPALDKAPRVAHETEPERLPRRPDRPSDPAAYRYPIAGSARVLGGFADVASSPSPFPMGEGIEIAGAKPSDVTALALEHQEGPSEVVWLGDLYGTTVVLAHSIKEGDRLTRYLSIDGYLERVAPNVVTGAKLDDGNVIGQASDAGVPGLTHVYFETRLVRAGMTLNGLDAKRLGDASLSVPCDARNLLPLVAR